MTNTDGPYRLDLARSNREWRDGEYKLTEEIEAWALENLKNDWRVHTDLIPQFNAMIVRTYWVEFVDYSDWLLFKLRWCDQ